MEVKYFGNAVEIPKRFIDVVEISGLIEALKEAYSDIKGEDIDE